MNVRYTVASLSLALRQIRRATKAKTPRVGLDVVTEFAGKPSDVYRGDVRQRYVDARDELVRVARAALRKSD